MTADNKPVEIIDILKGITVKEDGSFRYSGGPNGPFSAVSKDMFELFKKSAIEQAKTVGEIIGGQVEA